MNWQETVRKHLLRGSDWTDRNDEDVVDGLERALQRAEGPERAAMAEACFALLTDEDQKVRSGAVVAILGVAKEIGADRLCAVLEEHPECFVGVAPSGCSAQHDTLERELLSAVSHAATERDTRAIARLRETGLDPEWGSWVLSTLAKLDPEWVVEHAAQVRPQQVAIIKALPAPYREPFIRRRGPWPKEILENIGDPFWGQFQPDEAADLKRLMAGDG